MASKVRKSRKIIKKKTMRKRGRKILKTRKIGGVNTGPSGVLQPQISMEPNPKPSDIGVVKKSLFQKFTETLSSNIKKRLNENKYQLCLLYTSPSPRDGLLSRMPSSA